MSKKINVSLRKNEDISEACKTAISDILSDENSPNSKDEILLKPNVVMKQNYPVGTLTNPQVVRATAEWLIEHGAEPTNITIAESALTKQLTYDGLRNMGYYDMAEELGINVLNLYDTTPVTREIPNALNLGKIRTSDWIVDVVDFIVNMPVLKIHLMAGVTLGTKNLMGTIPTGTKSWLHHSLDKNIVDLANFINPNLTVIDGSTASEYAEIYGRPVKMDCIVASEEVFSADYVAIQLMGFKPEIIPYMEFVEDRYKNVNVIGDKIEDVKKDFEIPFTFKNQWRNKNVRI